MSTAKEFYNRGLAAEKAGRFQEALKNYKASAREDISFRPAFNNLGVLYARAGRPDLAIGFFNRALELEEDDIVHFNLGSEFFRLENYKESEHHLISALKKNRRLIRAHLLLAYLYTRENKIEKADIYFQNALKLDPRNRAAALGLAVSLAERDRNREALDLTDRYLRENPDDESFRNLRAGLLLKLNLYQESLQEFSELTKKSPEYTSFTDHLRAAREEEKSEYNRVFSGINDKIKERASRLQAKIEKRKRLLKKARSAEPPEEISKEELQSELKDMLDLSFLHLFNGDSEKALRFLFQARKMKQIAGQAGEN